MKLYLNHTGPFVRYADGLLYVEDLNPQVETRWRMSRWDMVVFGLRSLVAALRP